MENPNSPATPRQLWALFCATKEDHRKKGLTKQEASDVLSTLNGKSGFTSRNKKKSKKSTGEFTRRRGKGLGGGKEKLYKVAVNAGINKAAALLHIAIKAGEKAADDLTPVPMVVEQHADAINDNSPVVKSWKAPSGVCGFAWVNIKCRTAGNRKFINGLKKAGRAGKDHSFDWARDDYLGGYTFWIVYGKQSYEKKVAYSGAFVGVLCDGGVEAYGYSRLD